MASTPANLDSESLGHELRYKHACVHCPVPSRSPDPFRKPTNPVKCIPGTPCLETALEASPNGVYAGVPRPRIRYSIQTEYTLTVHPFRGRVVILYETGSAKSLSAAIPVARTRSIPIWTRRMLSWIRRGANIQRGAGAWSLVRGLYDQKGRRSRVHTMYIYCCAGDANMYAGRPLGVDLSPCKILVERIELMGGCLGLRLLRSGPSGTGPCWRGLALSGRCGPISCAELSKLRAE